MGGLESLLLLTCLSTEPACVPATKAYYAQSAPLKYAVKRAKLRYNEAAGIWAPFLAPSLLLIARGEPPQIRLRKGLTLKLGPDSGILNIDFEF